MWEISASNHICHSKPTLYFLDFRSLYISLPPRPSTLCVSLLFFLYVCLSFFPSTTTKSRKVITDSTHISAHLASASHLKLAFGCFAEFYTTKIYTQKCAFFTAQKRA